LPGQPCGCGAGKKSLKFVHLQAALALFSRLGVHVPALTQQQFTLAYYDLAKRYHPDRNRGKTAELMANINAAKQSVLNSYFAPHSPP
jgi:DnaJ-class molecular chaperone